MIASFTLYQLCLKFLRPEANALGFQTVAYGLAFLGASFLWYKNSALGQNVLQTRDIVLAVLFAASVIGLEYGYVEAYRQGWPIDSTPAMVTAATTVLLIPFAAVMLNDGITLSKLSGVALCIGGIFLISSK